MLALLSIILLLKNKKRKERSIRQPFCFFLPKSEILAVFVGILSILRISLFWLPFNFCSIFMEICSHSVIFPEGQFLLPSLMPTIPLFPSPPQIKYKKKKKRPSTILPDYRHLQTVWIATDFLTTSMTKYECANFKCWRSHGRWMRPMENYRQLMSTCAFFRTVSVFMEHTVDGIKNGPTFKGVHFRKKSQLGNDMNLPNPSAIDKM